MVQEFKDGTPVPISTPKNPKNNIAIDANNNTAFLSNNLRKINENFPSIFLHGSQTPSSRGRSEEYLGTFIYGNLDTDTYSSIFTFTTQTPPHNNKSFTFVSSRRGEKRGVRLSLKIVSEKKQKLDYFLIPFQEATILQSHMVVNCNIISFKFDPAFLVHS